MALLTPSVLVFSLQNCEAVDTCALGHSRCGARLWQHYEMNAASFPGHGEAWPELSARP